MHNDTEKLYLLKAMDEFVGRLIVVTEDFEIIAANYKVKNLHGESITGKQCYDVFYGRTDPCPDCAVIQSKQNGKPALRPKPNDFFQKRRIPCYYAYPIHDENHGVSYVSVDFDLPIDSGLEEKLQRTNAFLKNLILNAVDCVIAADRKGNLLIYNDMASKVFGYSSHEALDNLNIRDIYPEGVAYDVMRKLRSDDYGGKGKLRKYQVNGVAKNGEKIPIELNATIIYEEGQETATIGFFHDLRDEIEMREKLDQTRLQLLQAEKMSSLGKLAAGVAHQINNPLGGITLFSKLILEEYDLEENVKADLNRILKDAERCRETVKELLEFTRQTRYLKQPCDINEAISRALFLIKDQVLFHNIEIKKTLSPTLPKVSADIQQLNHVFMNIILNAAQAMGGRGVLTIESGLACDSDRLFIKISDTGAGIPEEKLPHIFDPFFTTKEEGEGTGLGLSLAYGIIKNHGGIIEAVNNPDGGASFIISIPLKLDAENGGQGYE